MTRARALIRWQNARAVCGCGVKCANGVPGTKRGLPRLISLISVYTRQAIGLLLRGVQSLHQYEVQFVKELGTTLLTRFTELFVEPKIL